jgi:hypothetical protein
MSAARRALLLAAVGAVALAARLHQIDEPNLWGDEFLSLRASSGWERDEPRFPMDVLVESPPVPTHLRDARPWWRTWTALDGYSHPPFYFLVLRAWREAFGESDAAARLLSVAWGMAGLALVFVLARRMHGDAVALWACLLFALAAPQVRYAQEARMYTMVTALVLAAAAVAGWAPPPCLALRRLVALAVLCLAAMLTHFHAAGPLAGIVLYAWWRHPGRRWRLGAAVFASAAAFALFWGPFLARQWRAVLLPAVWQRHDAGQGEALLRLFALPGALLTEAESWRSGSLAAAAALLVVTVAGTRRTELRLWSLVLAAHGALLATLDVLLPAHQLAFMRYSLAAGPAVCVLAAAALADRRGWIRHAPPAVAAVLALASLPRAYERPRPEWRAYADGLRGMGRDGDPVVLLRMPANEHRRLYVAIAHYGWPARSPVMVVRDGPAGDEAARLWRTGWAWVLGAEQPPGRRSVGVRLAEALPQAEVRAQLVAAGLPPCRRVALRGRDGPSSPPP